MSAAIAAGALRALVPTNVTHQARLAVYRALPARKRREITARILRRQARVCERGGSPLYGVLLRAAAADVERGGPSWSVLTGNERPGSVLALRFMGAVHRLVLLGDAPELAPYYPSVSRPTNEGDPVPAFLATVAGRRDRVRDLIDQPVQTNEVSRCAVLACGFLLVARRTRRPLRILELGASAGLNLLWDRYFYRSGQRAWGDPDSPVKLDDVYLDDLPLLDQKATVSERRGCDLSPLDPSSVGTALTLKSLVWADQVERFRTLEGALAVAAPMPARVDRAGAPDWLEEQLRCASPGRATVVFQSYVQQFLSAVAAARVAGALRSAGKRASADAPLAWLRLEPEEAGRAVLRLTSWPEGRDVAVAASTPHGRQIQWLLADGSAPAEAVPAGEGL